MTKLTCVECCAESSKYKCSVCFSSFCSVNCWKIHKNGPKCRKPETSNSISQTIKEKHYFETEDTVPPEKLQELGSNNEIRQLVKDKWLQQTIIDVDKSSDPYESVQKAMQDPLFVKFVDSCLEIIEPSELS